jgi:competence protein ComEC
MAASVAVGALWARPLPLGLAAAVAIMGWAGRRVALLVAGLALVASAMAARSWAGLHPPITGWFDGVVTLAGDPVDVEGALRVDIRVGGKRVEAWARGPAAAGLRDRLSGERVHLSGRVQRLPARLRARLASRHIAGRMSVNDAGEWAPGAPLTRAANGLRRTLVAGAASLRPDRQALFGGFVLGDDRGQPPEVVSDFRESGLTHLLVVSGENVAFVLALASPLLARFRLVSRLAVGVAVLVVFGTLVRWEPSVVRAEAMATLALFASAMGRPVSRLHLLALAITAVLLVDPLLVRSVGFLMSVGASAGIALVSARVAALVPGPRSLASAMGVTIGAQLGVAPVLIPVFGGLPLASVPANLLAVPAAGPIMMWGVAAGVPAGVVGGAGAQAVHIPTSVLVAWVAGVARAAAALPLGEVDGRTALVLGGALVVFLIAQSRAQRMVVALVTGLVVLAGPVASAVRPPPCAGCRLDDGVRLWRAGSDVVLVVDAARSSALLSSARRAAVRQVDLVVVTRPSLPSVRAIEVMMSRVAVARVVSAPPRTGREIPEGWWRITAPEVVLTARFRVELTPGPKGIEAHVYSLRKPSLGASRRAPGDD